MENLINKFKMNPFLSQTIGSKINPSLAIPASAPKGVSSVFTAPINEKPHFGHLAGVTQNGPGSFLQANQGQSGLGDRAIQVGDNTLGKKLFISC